MYYNLKKFGQDFKNLRKQVGFSQKSICDLTNMSQESLRKIENGKVIPKQETLDLLSIALKKDVYKLLLNCRIDQYDTYKQLINNFETQIECGNYDAMIVILEKLHLLLDDRMNDYYKNQIRQTILLVEHAIDLHVHHDRKTASDKLIAALRITNSNYTLDHFSTYNHSKLELQILMNLGVLLETEVSVQFALNIHHYCLEKAIQDPSLVNSRLCTKLYYNIAYAYHLIDNHEQVIAFATKGIENNISNRSLFCMGFLYARLGIAEHLLDRPGKLESLNKSYEFLILTGDVNQAEQLLNIVKQRYNLTLR